MALYICKQADHFFFQELIDILLDNQAEATDESADEDEDEDSLEPLSIVDNIWDALDSDDEEQCVI